MQDQFALAAGIVEQAMLAKDFFQPRALNFIRKPEFMGFNGYNDGIKRTEFNPNAWGDPQLDGEDHRGQTSTRTTPGTS